MFIDQYRTLIIRYQLFYLTYFLFCSAMTKSYEETKSLDHFITDQSYDIFRKAQTQPNFFKTHLTDPRRIIIQFHHDPNGYQKIFYFQYLVLCQPQAEGYPQIRRDNMKQLINNPDFTFAFPPQTKLYPYTDQQFKRIALQFIDLVERSNIKIIENIRKYPIVDQVFTYMMRSLLIINMQAQQTQQFIQKNQVFSVLSRIFDIEVEDVSNCQKFVEADIFVYEQEPFKTYMVYLEEIEKLQQAPMPSPVLLSPKKNSSKKEKNVMYKSNTSYGEGYQFVDFTGLTTEKPSNPNLFKSENLPFKSMFQQITESQKQQCSSPQKNQIKLDLPQICEIEICKDDFELQKGLQNVLPQDQQRQYKQYEDIRANMKKVEQIQVIKNQTDADNCLSGFQSNQDDIKIQVLPTETTISKIESTQNMKSQVDLYPVNSGYYQAKKPEFKEFIQTKSATEIANTKLTSQNIRMEEIPVNSNIYRYEINKKIQPSFVTNISVTAKIVTNFNNNYNDILHKKDLSSSKYQHVTQFQKDMNYKVKKTIPLFKEQPIAEVYDSAKKEKLNGYIPSFQLNVTKEFTNSFVLKQMPEIYQEGVRRARARARALRKTLYQYI